MESNPLPTPAAHESFAVYQREAHKTAGQMPARDRVFMASMGLAGEAGEVVDELKKVHFHAKPYDRGKLLRELGDVLWYLAELATAHGLSLQDIAHANLEKLRKRHGGETFKPHAEQNRTPEQCALVWNNEALNKGPQLGRFSPDERAELDDLKRKAFEAAAQPPPLAVDAARRVLLDPVPPVDVVPPIDTKRPELEVHGLCILSSPSATGKERERCNNEVARQVVDAHKMLDRLGAPGGSKWGSVRERLFYLLHLRGWTPNVRSPWGDDVVPDTLAHVEVKGQPIVFDPDPVDFSRMIASALGAVPTSETVVGVEAEDGGSIGYAPGLQRLTWRAGTVDVYLVTVGPRKGYVGPVSLSWSRKRWRLFFLSNEPNLQLVDETFHR